jgi:hypothetical protein
MGADSGPAGARPIAAGGGGGGGAGGVVEGLVGPVCDTGAGGAIISPFTECSAAYLVTELQLFGSTGQTRIARSASKSIVVPPYDSPLCLKHWNVGVGCHSKSSYKTTDVGSNRAKATLSYNGNVGHFFLANEHKIFTCR